MRSLALALLAISLLGCSIFNKPDRSRLDAYERDGGVVIDAWVPPDTSDGGFDANGDAHVCAAGEMTCDDGKDDDCDGLVDCADPDCVISHAAVCCMTGGTTSTEHFDKTGGVVWTTAANWTAAPSMASAITAAGVLTDMGSGPPIGMVNNTCLHVDLGTEIRFQMQAVSCTGAECDGRMEVVVGPSTSFGGMLTDDLAVRGRTVDGNLMVDVVQGGTVRATSTPLGAGQVDVVVTLSPGIAEGRNAIVGTVVAGGSQILSSQLFVTDRDIFGTSSCHGLHLGVQGTGNHVGLDNIQLTELDCSNPARFDAVRDDSDSIDAVTLSVSSSDHLTGWGRGGIGDPAIYEGAFGTGLPHRFFVLFDGSPVDRASDVIGHLPLAIGAADTTATGSTSTELALIDDCSRWMPRGGNIACMPPATATGHDLIESALVMRDAALYADGRDATTISAVRLVWAGETAPGSDLALFTSVLDATNLSARLGGPGTPIALDETAGCSSVRNPLLLPLVGTADWLLFYVCDSVFPPVVHAGQLHLTGAATTTRLDLELGPTELGPLASTGVTDIAGVVFNYPTGTTYRLWLTTRPSTTETAVLFIEGHPADGSPIPVFTPFAGNPVLTERSPVFGSCALGCQLHGITATRISNEPTRVRLLVERWVDTGSGLTYGLVPLESIWPTDH